MGFPYPGRAQEHDVAGLGEEPARCQRGDLGSAGGLGVPVEVLERLAAGEPCGFDAQVTAGGVPGTDLAFEDGGEVVLERPARIACLVG
jgi:hypothetical protein